MEGLKACNVHAMWKAVNELEDMASRPNTKKRLSAETLFIAIADVREMAERTRYKNIDNRRAAPENSDYMDGVKYAIYEIFKEADISGSQEIRDSGDTDDGMCARAAEKIRAELYAAPENKPLTLEQIREMDGEPVWIALLNIAKQPTCEVITKICEDGIHTVGTEGSDYASFDLYGKTWLAYARKPEGSEP